jgi:hypothetical protein
VTERPRDEEMAAGVELTRVVAAAWTAAIVTAGVASAAALGA